MKNSSKRCLKYFKKYHIQIYFQFFANKNNLCSLFEIWNEFFHRNNFKIYYDARFDKVLSKMYQNAVMCWSQGVNVLESCSFVLRLMTDQSTDVSEMELNLSSLLSIRILNILPEKLFTLFAWNAFMQFFSEIDYDLSNVTVPAKNLCVRIPNGWLYVFVHNLYIKKKILCRELMTNNICCHIFMDIYGVSLGISTMSSMI